MKQYLLGADSLLDNQIINPSWPDNERSLSDIQYIVVHHEAQFRPHAYDNTARYEAEARYQNSTSIPGSRGIQYHAHIDNQGTVTWLRPLTTYLWHCGNLDVNKKSIAVCVDGNLTEQQPTREQYEALKQLLDFWSTPASGAFPADQGDVYPHRQFSATNCCGDNLVPFVNEYRITRGNPVIPDVPFDWPEYQPVIVDKPVDSVQPSQTAPEYYRVILDGKQLGAFTKLENARKKQSDNPGSLIMYNGGVVATPAPDPVPVPEPTKEPAKEGTKETVRTAIIAGLSYLISLGLNYLTGLPETQLTVILTLVLKGIDKYIHENPNINLKGISPL